MGEPSLLMNEVDDRNFIIPSAAERPTLWNAPLWLSSTSDALIENMKFSMFIVGASFLASDHPTRASAASRGWAPPKPKPRSAPAFPMTTRCRSEWRSPAAVQDPLSDTADSDPATPPAPRRAPFRCPAPTPFRVASPRRGATRPHSSGQRSAPLYRAWRPPKINIVDERTVGVVNTAKYILLYHLDDCPDPVSARRDSGEYRGLS